ncbi:hypothetical protein BZG36_03226 [Bifiguratus adelaidae]|uniref:E3 ubiquitin protein ligase n=1 Tax=Bifiguratus adelaidae TaxID=1938954 RepID=A0A261XWU2_9FUNG|nr:hypothetical protein BZG36_03226 [Bifiguratus adelaidae]
MSGSDQDNKRSWSHLQDTTATAVRPPPFKKRFSTQPVSPTTPVQDAPRTNSSHPSVPANVDNADEGADPFNIEEFQKDAIYRQLREYKREVNRWQQRIAEEREFATARERDAALVIRQWEELTNVLSANAMEFIQQYELTTGALENTIPLVSLEAQSANDETVPERIVEILSSQAQQASPITHLINIITSWIRSLPKALQKASVNRIVELENGHYEQKVAELERLSKVWVETWESYRHTTSTYLHIKEELALTHTDFEVFKKSFDHVRLDLFKADKKFEQLKEKDSQAGTANGQGDTRTTSPMPEPEVDIEGDDESAKQNIQENGVSHSVKMEKSPSAIVNVAPDLQSQLAEQEVSQAIQELRPTLINLLKEVESYRLQMMNTPDTLIMETSPYKQIAAGMDTWRNRVLDAENRMNGVLKELEELKIGRRASMQEAQNAQQAAIKEMDVHLRKVEEELNEVRGQRDLAQQQLDDQKTMGEIVRSSDAESKILSETRAEWVKSLEMQVRRLKMKLLASRNEDLVVKIVGDSKYESLEEALQQLSEEKQSELAKLKDRVNGVIASAPQDYKDIFTPSLLSKFHLYNNLYTVMTIENASEANLRNHIQDQKQAKETEAKNLREKLAVQEKTNDQLAKEIENIGRVYTQLDEENSANLVALQQKEDELEKLTSEKMKYAQTFTMLNKAKDAHTLLTTALKKQTDKQLDSIKHLMEHEKSLTNQVAALDREIKANASVLEAHSAKVDEMTQQQQDLEKKVAIGNARYEEMQAQYIERVGHIENAKYGVKANERELRTLEAKVNALLKVHSPAESKLAKEVEELRPSLDALKMQFLQSTLQVPRASKVYAYIL